MCYFNIEHFLHFSSIVEGDTDTAEAVFLVVRDPYMNEL